MKIHLKGLTTTFAEEESWKQSITLRNENVERETLQDSSCSVLFISHRIKLDSSGPNIGPTEGTLTQIGCFQLFLINEVRTRHGLSTCWAIHSTKAKTRHIQKNVKELHHAIAQGWNTYQNRNKLLNYLKYFNEIVTFFTLGVQFPQLTSLQHEKTQKNKDYIAKNK